MTYRRSGRGGANDHGALKAVAAVVAVSACALAMPARASAATDATAVATSETCDPEGPQLGSVSIAVSNLAGVGESVVVGVSGATETVAIPPALVPGTTPSVTIVGFDVAAGAHTLTLDGVGQGSFSIFECPDGSVPPTATIGDVTRAGCQVTIPVTTTGTGPFELRVYDDFDVVDSVEWDTPSDASITTLLSWLIAEPAREQAPGVGFYVFSSGEQLTSLDPWEYPASAADACAEAGDMSVALIGYTGTVAPGGTIEVEASGFYPDEPVTATLQSTPVSLGSFTATADGTISATLRIPPDAEAGAHTIVLEGLWSGFSVSTPVTIASAGTAEPTGDGTAPGTLPATGAGTASVVQLAAVVVTAGLLALLAGRRRPERST